MTNASNFDWWVPLPVTSDDPLTNDRAQLLSGIFSVRPSPHHTHHSTLASLRVSYSGVHAKNIAMCSAMQLVTFQAKQIFWTPALNRHNYHHEILALPHVYSFWGAPKMMLLVAFLFKEHGTIPLLVIQIR